ncbi:hypothetical protein BS50DRAFT_90746 [Corynespora cassiicola Philippines]|uniref:Uncharacterized protein n=1 Tax=Corynespora cassiicola Philippines TaxID=1448308 RepID=A0A2T2NEJ9_CORCC|nr:hypothetical protein BS50DRAFT_90746 [Corynespora cassiicola Philippines]
MLWLFCLQIGGRLCTFPASSAAGQRYAHTLDIFSYLPARLCLCVCLPASKLCTGALAPVQGGLESFSLFFLLAGWLALARSLSRRHSLGELYNANKALAARRHAAAMRHRSGNDGACFTHARTHARTYAPVRPWGPDVGGCGRGGRVGHGGVEGSKGLRQRAAQKGKG